MLVARWIGFPAGTEQHLLLDTGTLCVLGYYREIPAVKGLERAPSRPAPLGGRGSRPENPIGA
jgi:hypothetical protein